MSRALLAAPSVGAARQGELNLQGIADHLAPGAQEEMLQQLLKECSYDPRQILQAFKEGKPQSDEGVATAMESWCVRSAAPAMLQATAAVAAGRRR